MKPVPVSYIFDAGFERCTLVSVFSLLRHSPVGNRILLFSDITSDGYHRKVERLAAAFPDSNIESLGLPHGGAHGGTRGHISSATMLRLFLHRVIEGRTLYIDGDTLIRRDIRPLLGQDLGGQPLGACLSPRVHASLLLASRMRWAPWRRTYRSRIAALSAIAGLDPGSYFNAGVLVLDMKRIRDGGFVAALEDWQTAETYPNRDQDHLNIVFRHRFHRLAPEWNSIWGNAITARRIFSASERADYAASRNDPAILHFTGSKKPWHNAPHARRLERRHWQQEWINCATALDKVLGNAA
jgi:lipopolysaccharide biosynthesis glycosyltransferase